MFILEKQYGDFARKLPFSGDVVATDRIEDAARFDSPEGAEAFLLAYDKPTTLAWTIKEVHT